MKKDVSNPTENELSRFNWLLEKEQGLPAATVSPAYKDVTALNRDGLILNAVGSNTLQQMSDDVMTLLDTSMAVYEKNGDYAFGTFVSCWCGTLDNASRALCETDDNRTALDCGKWLCHERCWAISKAAMESGKPADEPCCGGLHIYAVPICSGDQIIGVINFGYGTPPGTEAEQKALAKTYQLDLETIQKNAESYKPRPPFIIDEAKRRLQTIARMIGEIVERKQAERILRAEKLYSESLITSLPGVFYLISQEGRFLRWNKRFETVTGRSAEEMAQISLIDLFEGNDKKAMAAAIEQVFTLRSVQVEGRLVAKDGKKVPYQFSGDQIFVDGEPFLIGLGVDISERKKTEEALRQSEAAVQKKLAAIVNPNGNIGTLELSDIIDAKILQSLLDDFYHLTGILGAILDTSGKILVAVGWQDICTKFHRVHPESCKNCLESDTCLTQGVEPGTFKAYHCKNHMWDMVTPLMIGDRHVGNVFIGQFFYEDDVPDLELFRAQARKYGFDEKEYLAALDRVPRFSKETVTTGMEFYAKLAQIISSLSFSQIQQSRLLTERKRAEEALHAREATLREAQKVAHLGSFEYVAAMQTTVWSEEEYHIYGRDPNESSPDYETMLKEYIHPEDAAILNEAFMQAMQNESVYELEHRIVHPDGSVRWVRDRAQPYFDEQGALVRYIGITLDITEHKQAEAEIRTLNAELEQRVRERTAQLQSANHELEAFSYSVSHDLRAPLRHLTGYAELLQKNDQANLDEKARRHLTFISESAVRMGQLIDDLLAFSRTGRTELKKETVDLNALVKEVLNELSANTEDRKICWKIAPLPQTQADPTLLRAVLTNLFSNALKFSRTQDEALIEMGVMPPARRGLRPGEADERETIFFIRDNGIGFDMRYVDKLFGVFQRLHSMEQFEGTGIGLANVRRIIQRHGGRTWAESVLNEGATFYFTLPKPT